MNDADKNRKILNSFTGEIKNGHHQIQGFSGDYNEAFTFWEERKITDAVLRSQKEVAAELKKFRDASASPEERERLQYLLSHIDFLSPFADSWKQAHQLHVLIQDALKLKRGGQ